MLSREEYRKIKSMSKEEMDRWLAYHNYMTNNNIRKEYEAAYRDELDSSIQNFLFAVAYTLHWNEDVAIDSDKMASFMKDLFVTVDLFRSGDYKPSDYKEALAEDGVEFSPYDYDKLYRECREKVTKQYLPYKERNEKAMEKINEFMEHNENPSCNLGDLELVQSILRGDL